MPADRVPIAEDRALRQVHPVRDGLSRGRVGPALAGDQLIAGADAMQDKANTTPRDIAINAVRAVNDYGRYFDHPGLKPLG
jgi:hypothetical protein